MLESSIILINRTAKSLFPLLSSLNNLTPPLRNIIRTSIHSNVLKHKWRNLFLSVLHNCKSLLLPLINNFLIKFSSFSPPGTEMYRTIISSSQKYFSQNPELQITAPPPSQHSLVLKKSQTSDPPPRTQHYWYLTRNVVWRGRFPKKMESKYSKSVKWPKEPFFVPPKWLKFQLSGLIPVSKYKFNYDTWGRLVLAARV